MKVHWTERAKRRLRLLHNHIAKDSPIIAPQVIDRLVRRSIQIGDVPYTGRAVPEYQREDVREILERPYVSGSSHRADEKYPSLLPLTVNASFTATG